MLLSDAVYALLAYVGATLILVRGTIFRRLRRSVPALACAQCTGFWVGLLGQLWLTYHSGLRGWSLLESVLMGACTVSVCAMTLDIVLLKLAGGPEDADN